MVTCDRNVNLQEIDPEPSTGRNLGFVCCKKYSTRILNKILLW